MAGGSSDKLFVFTSTNIYDSTLIDTETGEVAFRIQPVQYSTWVYTDNGVRREQVLMNATLVQNEKGLALASLAGKRWETRAVSCSALRKANATSRLATTSALGNCSNTRVWTGATCAPLPQFGTLFN